LWCCLREDSRCCGGGGGAGLGHWCGVYKGCVYTSLVGWRCFMLSMGTLYFPKMSEMDYPSVVIRRSTGSWWNYKTCGSSYLLPWRLLRTRARIWKWRVRVKHPALLQSRDEHLLKSFHNTNIYFIIICQNISFLPSRTSEAKGPASRFTSSPKWLL